MPVVDIKLIAIGANQSANELAFLIQVGIQELRDKVRRAIFALDDTASPLPQLMAKQSVQMNSSHDSATEAWRQAYPDIVEDIDAQLSALDRLGYALGRAITGLEDSQRWLHRLANHDALRRLGAVLDKEDFPELSWVLTAWQQA